MGGQQIIVVDYDLLGQSASSLGSIGAEFQNAAKIRAQVAGYLGSGVIAAAMGDFSGNWDRKRRDLITKIDATGRAVGLVMASFSEQDRAAASFDLSYRPGPLMSTTETRR
jgi:hypothetical protein